MDSHLNKNLENVLIDKVLGQSTIRLKISNISIDKPNDSIIKSLKFYNGIIIPNSLVISECNEKEYKKIQFKLLTTYMIIFKNSDGKLFSQKGTLPTQNIETILKLPTKDYDGDYDINVITSSKICTIDNLKDTITVETKINTFATCKSVIAIKT